MSAIARSKLLFPEAFAPKMPAAGKHPDRSPALTPRH